tara:strand:+ start:546 stop:1118 length:573 start_codon:yes stop_codon:yes gene_type:complete
MCVTAIVASAVAGVAAASQQAKVARQSTERAYEAEAGNFALVQKENTRLQRESNDLYDTEVSDRVRLSHRELGSLSVLLGEMGASNSSATALRIDQSYTSGMDISRIEQSRINQIESLQASKRAGQQGYLNQTTLAYSQGAAAVANANASAIGSITGGMSSYGGYEANKRDYDLKLRGLNRGKQSGYTEY